MAYGLSDAEAANWDNQARARLRLYSPGGAMARELAKNPTVLVVNDIVFCHGGLLPQQVRARRAAARAARSLVSALRACAGWGLAAVCSACSTAAVQHLWDPLAQPLPTNPPAQPPARLPRLGTAAGQVWAATHQ